MTLTMENLQEQISKLQKEVSMLKIQKNLKLLNKKLEINDVFELAGLKWKVLDITEKGYFCLADKLEKAMMFDSNCNDWKTSRLREYLNTEFYKKLCEEIGKENIVPFERNLVSLDGQTEYGTCIDKVSLLSVDEYRKYRKLIPNTNYYWWMLTPDSTKCNNDARYINVVRPSGDFSRNCCSSSNGVRPVCIFPSSIFESEE